MGKKILTTHQSAILEYAAVDPKITAFYYFTGGTALTEFYLQHRLSEDLDFFTESDINPHDFTDFFVRYEKVLSISNTKVVDRRGMYFLHLTFTDSTELKVDFVNFPFPSVETGKKYKKLVIDSIFDIALNKLYTLSDRARARDYIDLYCILTTQDISFEQVLSRMNEKFHPFSFNDAINLGVKLTRVQEVTEWPIMLVPFDRAKMVDFFLKEAKKLGKKIFK